jgi:hypothetical protein
MKTEFTSTNNMKLRAQITMYHGPQERTSVAIGETGVVRDMDDGGRWGVNRFIMPKYFC